MRKKKAKYFYVYEHWRPDKDICFYVGKGTERRAWTPFGRSKWHRHISEKLKSVGLEVDVRIIDDGLTDEASKALEIERIAFWKAAGVKLINLTDGGDGAPQRQISAETRAKLSAANTGHRHSEETKAKLRAINLGKKHGPRSPECVAKLRAHGKAKGFRKGHVPTNKGKRLAKQPIAHEQQSLPF